MGSNYDDIVQGLRKANGETISSDSQRYFAVEPDLAKFDNTTKALRVVSQWAEKITEGLDTKKEILAAMNRARVRSWHNSSLRTFRGTLRQVQRSVPRLTAVKGRKGVRVEAHACGRAENR